MVTEHGEKHHIQDGPLVIDDSGAHKTGQYIEGAKWFWDHTTHTPAFGHQLVTSQYVTTKFHVPLHYRLYRKEKDVGKAEFKSKLDLAIELIANALFARIVFNG
jgi:hypothetical protein